MPLLAAMLVGAIVGAVAAVVVYGIKTAWTHEPWSWRDAGAAAAGGLVGGALFPPLMAGLVALGLPAAAAYVVSGGIAWGGIWTLAQDAASVALGRAEHLGSWTKYATATAVGAVLSVALLPLAGRALTPAAERGGLALTRHSGEAAEYLIPAKPLAANVAKSHAEFVAYGVAAEGATAAARSLASGLAGSGAREIVRHRATRAARGPTPTARAIVNAPLGEDRPAPIAGAAAADSTAVRGSRATTAQPGSGSASPVSPTRGLVRALDQAP